jgi:hypothetical protein
VTPEREVAAPTGGRTATPVRSLPRADGAPATLLRLQRAVGNTAVTRLVGGRRRALARTNGKRKRADGLELLGKGAVKGVLDPVTKERIQKGRWSKKVRASGTKSFAGKQRDPQILRQLSAQLYLLAKEALARTDEQEVQSMLFRDRIVVAANKDASLEAIEEELNVLAIKHAAAVAARDAALQAGAAEVPEAPVHPLREVLESVQDPSDERAKGVAAKMHGLFAGTRAGDRVVPGGAGALLLDIARSQAYAARAMVSSESGCAAALTSPLFAGKIVFALGAPKEMHAEQKLIWTLWLSKQKSAAIYGKKRPCAFCNATFAFASAKLGLEFVNNPNPGGVFKTAGDGLQVLANEAIRTGKVPRADVHQWLEEHVEEYRTGALITHQSRSIEEGRRAGDGSPLPDIDQPYPDPEFKWHESKWDSGSESEIDTSVARPYVSPGGPRLTRPPPPKKKRRKHPRDPASSERPGKRQKRTPAAPRGYDADGYNADDDADAD